MALIHSPNCESYRSPFIVRNPNFKCKPSQFPVQFQRPNFSLNFTVCGPQRHRVWVVNASPGESGKIDSQNDEVNSAGVNAALSMLRFYKREISPFMPKSCRYVPTCSEYSMIAYKKYGVVKGTVLTAWRLCRCNPIGGSGFDPPRWFDETTDLPEE